MSKSNQTPIILKKNDSQRQQKSASIQPKILTKSSNKEIPSSSAPPSVPAVQIKKENEVLCELQAMKSSTRFMFPHFNIDQKIFDFLDNENSDFLVVAAIGEKNSGKSTLMNMIADQNYVKVESNGNFEAFKVEHEIFNTRKSQNYEGSTIDMFITTDRIFVLDPSPICSNFQKRDMIVAESDDLKMLLMLFQLCHLVVVTYDGYPNLSLLRMINLADMMIPSEIKHRPNFIYIANNMQPGTKDLPIDLRIHNGCRLTMPNLFHRSLHLHHDVAQVIQDYQEQIFMLKRYSLMEDEEEIFTEKKWSQRVMQVVESLKGEYFLRKYDGLRDKYHQPVEGS